MLADGKIDSLDTHLEQFKLNNQATQNDLQNLLKEYSLLLEDYKALKKIHEGNQGQPATLKPVNNTNGTAERPRRPYVLVLVDGNGYIFNDELVREKEEGGLRAARMINEAIEKYIRESVPHAKKARIVVRVYADLTNLSKQLAKTKVTGLEKRSIAPFSAAFTRAFGSFDFIDTLDEDGTEFKIREQFTYASEDNACSHIFYAACHDRAYLSQVVPLSGLRDKITLVQAAGWLSDFHQFNLNVTQFPTIFRWTELTSSITNSKTSNEATATNDKLGSKQQNAFAAASWRGGTPNNGSGKALDQDSSTASSQQPCRFFQKGFCRNGNKCTFQHGAPNRQENITRTSTPSSKSNVDRSNISFRLPQSAPTGYIPVNKDYARLDTCIRPPTQAEWLVYNARFHKKKPCNAIHLQGACGTDKCPFDHSELEPEARHVLEYVLKCSPCPRRSQCRVANCIYGHICQKDGCQGQLKGCKMKADLHAIDPKATSMVLAEEEEEEEEVFGAGIDMPHENEYMW